MHAMQAGPPAPHGRQPRSAGGCNQRKQQPAACVLTMMVDASKMKVAELRQALGARGLGTSGLKKVLVARLEDAHAYARCCRHLAM